MIPPEVQADLRLISQYQPIERRMQAILATLNWPEDTMQDTCTWLISNTQSDDDPGNDRMMWSDVLKDVINDVP